MLIIFDRIFGTYVPETEKVDYGVTTGFIGHNPFKILFQPLFQYLKKAFGRKGHISEKQEIKFLK
jgi:sterol desaturase/sphingolipid hydroxylase (fatty acid hydroxylase superfamily)